MYGGLYTALRVGMIKRLSQFYRSREQRGSRNYWKQFACDVKVFQFNCLISLFSNNTKYPTLI